MTALVDTNVIIGHLTEDPPAQAAGATRFLAASEDLLLADLVVAEVVYVLESYYEMAPEEVGRLVRTIVVDPRMVVVDRDLLLRALEVDALDFAEAYLVASADRSGVGAVASFDRSIDRVGTVSRLEP